MREMDSSTTEPDDFILIDEAIDWAQEDYEKELGTINAKHGIDNFFESKELDSLDDWFDEIE